MSADRQLWVITGTAPVTWQIPVWVLPEDGGTVHLQIAMALTPYQHGSLRERLGAKEEFKPGHWILTKAQLARFGSQVEPTGQQEDHFVWGRRPAIKLSIQRRRKRAERNELLSRMYLMGLGKSEAEIEYWHNQFCNAILWHLINRETPIDFYFFRLHACPFRRNWHESLRTTLRHTWRENMPTLSMFAWDGEAMARSIELEILPLWWRYSRRVEHDRIKLQGRTAYVEEYKAWAIRTREQWERVHSDWLVHCALQRLQLDPGGRYKPRKGAVAGFRAGAKPAARLSKAERDRQIKQRAQQHRLQSLKAEHMRRVQRIQRLPQHLRDARGYLRDANGQFLAGGMPLRDAIEGEPTLSDVLAERPRI